MTKEEFSKFSMALQTYYPKENLIPNNQAMELWYRQLKDIPYNVAGIMLNKWAATNKWSPSIADIRSQAVEITMGDKPEWSEGWRQVQRAIRMHGSYNINKAMELLDDVTRQTVERLGFINLCNSTNVTADRANFRSIFEQIAERKQQEKQIPAELHKIISMVQQEIGDGERKKLTVNEAVSKR